MLLYLTSDPTDCTDLSSTEFSDLKLAIEHPLDKGSVFVDLEWLTYQFELLHHLKVGIKLDHNAGHTNSEMRNILPQVILKFLNSNEGGTQCIGRPVEGCIAETEFRCVFDHSQTIGCHIICAIDWDGLEFSPSHRQNNWIFIL